MQTKRKWRDSVKELENNGEIFVCALKSAVNKTSEQLSGMPTAFSNFEIYSSDFFMMY